MLSKTINDLRLTNNIIVNSNNERVKFSIHECCIFDVHDEYLKITLKNLDNLFPMIAFEKSNNLESSFSLEEDGICLKLFTKTNNFKDIIGGYGSYNIEFFIDSIEDSHITCKVLRIIDVSETVDKYIDVAEPDDHDIEDIKQNIIHKIKKIKKKYVEISKLNISLLTLTELISLDDNLYDFFQNNI